MTDELKATREDALKFLGNACRNWPSIPPLSDDDVNDVAIALGQFVKSTRPAAPEVEAVAKPWRETDAHRDLSRIIPDMEGKIAHAKVFYDHCLPEHLFAPLEASITELRVLRHELAVSPAPVEPGADMVEKVAAALTVIDVTASFAAVGSGLLGAVAYGPNAARLIEGERLLMIEKRILRMEMLLRRSGIEPESIPLPNA